MDGFYSKRMAEERAEWRQHPMSQLAFALLREQQAEAARVALEMPADAAHTHVVANISYHKAIADIIRLLETDG
jgi:hypothetical protein